METGKSEFIKQRPMNLFVFTFGALFALAVRTFFEQMARKEAVVSVMRW